MKKQNLYFIVILISLANFFITQIPAIINPFAINEDIRPNYYMVRLHDSSLLKDDFYADYLSSPIRSPWGYKFFYYIITYFMNLSYAHVASSLILLLIASLYIFKIGCCIKDIKMGFFMLLFFTFYSWVTADFSGPSANSFGNTILIIFTYYLLNRNIRIISLLFILMYLFYPPLFFLLVTTLILLTLKTGNTPPYFKPKELLPIIYITICCFLISMYLYYYKVIPNYGEIFTYAEMKNMPIFKEGGRLTFFPFISLANQIKHYFYEFNLFFILIIILFFILRKRMFSVPKPIYAIIFSSIILFILSVLILFKLYVPETYIQYSIPLFLIILSSFGCSIFLDNKTITKITAALLFICIFTILHFNKMERGITYYKDIQLYEFISKKLDKNTLIAGHPNDMDEIAFFGKRKFFVSYELSHPFFKKYYAEIEKRTYAFFSFYYSDSLKYIYQICKDNKINYILVNTDYFNKEYMDKQNFYIEPFNIYIKNITCNKSFFALNNIPKKYRVFSEKNKFIVKTEDLILIN